MLSKGWQTTFRPFAQAARSRLEHLLKSHLVETSQLAAVQALAAFGAQDLDRAHADAQMLIDAFAIELVGHAGQLDLAMQGLVAHAQQGAIRDAEAEAVGGDGGAFHVQRDGAALAETTLWLVAGQQLPVA